MGCLLSGVLPASGAIAARESGRAQLFFYKSKLGFESLGTTEGCLCCINFIKRLLALLLTDQFYIRLEEGKHHTYACIIRLINSF